MADVVMAYVVMAYGYGLCNYGLLSYGLCSSCLYTHGLSSYGPKAHASFRPWHISYGILVMAYLVMVPRRMPASIHGARPSLHERTHARTHGRTNDMQSAGLQH